MFRGTKQIEETNWHRNKAKSLLKWFILNKRKLFSAEQLIDRFWPDIEADAALRNLYVTIYHLRRVLEPELQSRQKSSFIQRNTHNFYWFDMSDSWWADVTNITHLFERARLLDHQGEVLKAEFYYRKIASYCDQGFVVESTDEAWLYPYIHDYNRIFLSSIKRLLKIYSQRNDLDTVIEYAYQALHLDPYCKLAAKSLVNAYFEQGNITSALKVLDNFQDLLQKNLQLDLGNKFSLLRERITSV